MRRVLTCIFLLTALFAEENRLFAQNWTNVLTLNGNAATSAFFFNASEGFIGTGFYFTSSATPANIYYTHDGGTTWQQAQFQNPQIVGQVTDIYFRDRLHGWATIREALETGWSGIYHSKDGGRTWSFVHPAVFPGGIRETKRGIFYTDRDFNPGVMFSSDQGKTWVNIIRTTEPLGIDFMDDATGFVTTQANALGPHLLTVDSGNHWTSFQTGSEAWTPYGDPITRNFFLASEGDKLTPSSTQSAIIKVPASATSELKIRTYGDSAITGGIAGSHICQSIIYVQGRVPVGNSPQGLVRSIDVGQTWVNVGGPFNRNDTRFAVTGRGAVVFAFDIKGGVWRTVNGGDGTLSPSVLPFLSLTSVSAVAETPVCDSTYLPVQLNYSACDSAQIAGVTFLNDSLHELSVPSYSNAFRFFSSARQDTLKILYQPRQQRNFTARVQLTIRQSDGYIEDTILTLYFQGLPSRINTLALTGTTGPSTIDFDSVSLCTGAIHKVTLSNTGCSDLTIESMQVIGAPFTLISSFKPFVLSPGTDRTFLIADMPAIGGLHRGALLITHNTGFDSVVLTGFAYSPDQSLSLTASQITSPLCDSAPFTIALRNIACKALKIVSVSTSTLFEAGALPSTDSLHSGENANLNFTFVPANLGPNTDTIHITVSYDGIGRYDTTLTLTGTGTSGKPDVALSRPSLDFGSITICEDFADTLFLKSTGCSDVTINSAFDVQNGFSFIRAPKSTLLQGESDTVIILFHPTNVGTYSANLVLATNAGTKTIPLSVIVTADSGRIALAVPSDIHSYTCVSQSFTFSVTNSTCDSIVIESATIGGVNSQDFSVNATFPIVLRTGEVRQISGTFLSQNSLVRTASISLHIKRADGTLYDTTFDITATGITPPPILVTLSNEVLHAKAGGNATIHVYALNPSTVSQSVLDFGLRLNTDLLTPLRISPGIGSFGNASVMRFSVKPDSLSVELAMPSDTILAAGELCEIECQAYVSSSLSTDIVLQRAQFSDASGLAVCLTTQSVADSITTFVLDRDCGDTMVAQFIGTQTLTLDRVTPNPTSGIVMLSFTVSQNYENEGVLEIYDALGEKLRSMPLVFTAPGQQTLEFDLTQTNGLERGEGVRYLRIRTPSGLLTSNVILLK